VKKGHELRWGVERRLEFLEFRFFWKRHAKRTDLVDASNILLNQASTDLSRQKSLVPARISYGMSARTYVRTRESSPLFLHHDADNFVSQLRFIADGKLDRSASWTGHFPDHAAAPIRGVKAKFLRAVFPTIQQSEAIEIKYRSFSRPEPCWRWIALQAQDRQIVLLNNEAVHEAHG
jgi:hypothetical protein